MTEKTEAPLIDPTDEHPDNIEMLPIDSEADATSETVIPDEAGIDDLLPDVTDDEPIVGE